MKLFITGIALASTLLLTQGCSSQVKYGEAASTATDVDANPHEGHNMGDSKTPEGGQHSHGSHSQHSELEPANAIAKLILVSKITPKTPVDLVIDLGDKEGKSIANFDKFQEKLMHLIVVSDDLQHFNHIHPTYKGNGRFEVQANFPAPGGYTLFSDYKPAGKAEQVSVLKAQVPGKSIASSEIDLNTNKTFGKTKVNFKPSQAQMKAGKEVRLIFNLQDATSNQPLNDLQPYLGERGHLVILKQSSQLTKADYIHAHALQDTPVGEIHFITKFTQPGKYKLWGQFNRNGEITTADFWVNVE